jgi:methylmalonyl-CoA mutase N-terminal domain/subunit
VGVNRYREKDEGELKTVFKVDPESEKRQIERLNRLKQERNNKKVEEQLEAVRRSAENGENMVPPILEAVRVYATIGEICDQLRKIYGEAAMGGFF